MSTPAFGRRALVKGAAWATPAIISASTVPAYAVSTKPSVICEAANQVIAQVSPTLRGVDFYTSARIKKILNVRVSNTDISNRFIQLIREWRAANNNATPTSDVTTKLRQQATADLGSAPLKYTGLAPAFAANGQSIETILNDMLCDTALGDHIDADSALRDSVARAISAKPEEFLLGLAYMKSLYNFEIGGKNVADTYFTDPAALGATLGGRTIVDQLISLGSNNATTLSFSNAPANITRLTTLPDLRSFLDRQLALAGESDANAWFKKTSKAIISDDIAPLYNKLISDTSSHRYILPLLSLPSDSVFVMSTPGSITFGNTYSYVAEADDKTAFTADVNTRTQQQSEFVELWTRLNPKGAAGNLDTNRISTDGFRVLGSTAHTEANWLPKTADGGVEDFFAPLNLWSAYQNVGAQALGTDSTSGMNFFSIRVLSDDGVSTFGHEMVHLIDNNVLLNGYRRRDGLGVEVYPRGIFEGPSRPNAVNFYDSKSIGFNEYYDWSGNNNRLYNATPDQFQTKDDLSNYMRNMLDTLYTLDAIEANAILSRTTDEKVLLLNKLEQTPRGDGNNNDTFRKITADEAATIQSLADFTTGDYVVSRYKVRGTDTTGTVTPNSYYEIPLFDPAFGAYTPATGTSGDITVRRQAFDLLAYKGYDGGLVPYLSNQYKAQAGILSDEYIFNAIGINNYEADRVARYQNALNRAGELFPLTLSDGRTLNTVDDLKKLMDEAVAADLKVLGTLAAAPGNIWGVTNVQKLKEAVYLALRQKSGDFANTIY